MASPPSPALFRPLLLLLLLLHFHKINNNTSTHTRQINDANNGNETDTRNPYYLDPPSDTPLPTVDAGNDVVKNVLNYNSDLKTWQTPFVMAMINCRVVRKSNALTGYGRLIALHAHGRTHAFIKGTMINIYTLSFHLFFPFFLYLFYFPSFLSIYIFIYLFCIADVHMLANASIYPSCPPAYSLPVCVRLCVYFTSK